MNTYAMPVLENKMVERAYPLRSAVTEYAESNIFIQSRTIDPSICGQDIAARKKEQISALHQFTHSREATSRRHDSNLWR